MRTSPNRSTPAASPPRRRCNQLQGSGLDATQSLATIDRMINAQAYVLSADDIFYASAVIFFLLLPIPLGWLTRSKKVAGADAAGGAH